MREEAEQFVADFYAVDVETARKFFNDEIDAYMRLVEAEERMNDDETFPRGTPEAVRIQANGPTLFYTYPDQDSSIPEGYRRVATEIYLEPYPVSEQEKDT